MQRSSSRGMVTLTPDSGSSTWMSLDVTSRGRGTELKAIGERGLGYAACWLSRQLFIAFSNSFLVNGFVI